MALAALAGACGDTTSERGASQQPQGASLRVTIGTQEFPEARILGELWRQALAVNGYAVNLRKGVGPAEDLDQALRDGEIDGYVAYTGTVLSIVAGEEVSGLDPDETYEQARAFYETQDMAMSEMTPFQNKDAIATTTSFADENDLTDHRRPRQPGRLRARRPARVREPVPRPRGAPAGLRAHQRDVRAVRARAQYDALDNGDADAVDAFTTDPQLETGDTPCSTTPSCCSARRTS